MKKISFSRKTLKVLAKRLSYLIDTGVQKTNAEYRFLIQRIRYIIRQSGFRKRAIRRIFGATVVVLGLGISSSINAQAFYNTPVVTPFNLDTASQFAFPAEVDLDNDGDLDLLVGEYNGNFRYFENIGTAIAPNFSTPVSNPFGLSSVNGYFTKPTFADLDNDGDMDLLTSEYNFNSTTYAYSADLKYFENIGTASVPNFAAPVLNPFGIPSNVNSNFRLPELVDIDNDGDYDLMSLEYNGTNYNMELRYYQNVGSAAAPTFGPAQVNPFGINIPQVVGFPEFADLDNDGDLDFMYGESYSTGGFLYYVNTGSASAPSFIGPISNPFALVPLTTIGYNNSINAPVLMDLDGDSDLDVLSGTYGGNLIYFENIFTNVGALNLFDISLATPSCSPGGDGIILVTAGGGLAPITYKIGTDSNTTGLFTNYSVGTYTLRVRDSANTIIDTVITMNTSSPVYDSMNSFISNVTCNGANDGFIAISQNGGTSPYTYQLLPGLGTPISNNFFFNLGGNTYTAIITDSKNCSDTASITIIEPAAININIDSSSNPSCFGNNNGAIYTTTTGGNGNFNYMLTPNAGMQSPPGDFTNLPAGMYTITATDLVGCSASVVQSLTQPPNTLITTIDSIIDVSCFGGNDGKICISSTGGLAPYTYNPSTTNGCIQNLIANNYSVSVTDANGCSSSTNIVVTQPPQLVINVSSTQAATSSTAMDGSITGQAIGGVAPYSYSITPNAGTQTPPGTFTGLGSGNYTITVTDATNCTNTTTTNVGFWPTNVNDIEKHNINLYPNPVSDILRFESDIEIQALSILDITGKIVISVDKPNSSISLKEVPSGIYVVKLDLKNKESVYTRIVKQ